MTIKILFLRVLFLALMIRSNLSEEYIFPSYTVLLNIVRWMMNLEGKDVLFTLEGCEEFRAFRAAELFRIHLNHVLSPCKKRCVDYNKYLTLDATILSCIWHILK
jgi:hypothetical protein